MQSPKEQILEKAQELNMGKKTQERMMWRLDSDEKMQKMAHMIQAEKPSDAVTLHALSRIVELETK